MSRLTIRLQQRYIAEGDQLAMDALTCIRHLEKALNDLVETVDPTEKKRRAPLKNAHALLRKLRGE